MKKVIVLLLLLPTILISQNYVDIFKIGYGETFNNDFEDTDSETNVKSFDVGFTYPIVLNDNQAIITGADFASNKVQLAPESDFTNLYSTNLKLGLASTWSEKWSTTIVLLPKIASDYNNISSKDFYMGGFALLKRNFSEKLIYRFGIYSTQEAYGLFVTPLIGIYYLSENSKFEIDATLPIAADINYSFEIFSAGMDYNAIGRTFKIYTENTPTVYADLSSLEFAGYFQYNALQKSVLLRAKLGYSTNNYEVYAEDENIDLGLSAFTFGDDREQLNTNISGGIFFRAEAIYRFNLPSKE